MAYLFSNFVTFSEYVTVRDETIFTIFSLVEQKSGSCLKTAAKTQKRLHKREGDRSFLFHLLSMNHDPNHLHFFPKVLKSHSFIYSWFISHILEHEIFSLGHFSRKEKKSFC